MTPATTANRMKDRTKQLLDQIEVGHDWRCGQVYGGQGDVYTSTDECRICGLVRKWHSGSRQNSISASTTFFPAHSEEPIPLREAAALKC